MPMLTLSNDQVVEIVRQLPTEQQTEIFRFLLLQQWGQWESLSRYGMNKVKIAAEERGEASNDEGRHRRPGELAAQQSKAGKTPPQKRPHPHQQDQE